MPGTHVGNASSVARPGWRSRVFDEKCRAPENGSAARGYGATSRSIYKRPAGRECSNRGSDAPRRPPYQCTDKSLSAFRSPAFTCQLPFSSQLQLVFGESSVCVAARLGSVRFTCKTRDTEALVIVILSRESCDPTTTTRKCAPGQTVKNRASGVCCERVFECLLETRPQHVLSIVRRDPLAW